MTRQRIGVSCWLPLGVPSGARTRLLNLLRGLERLEEAADFDWVLLGNGQSAGFATLYPIAERLPGGELHSLPIPERGRQRVQAERRLLPRACEELGLHVLDLQSLPVPELPDTRIVTTVHDLRDRTAWRRGRIHQLLALPFLRSALERSHALLVPSPQVREQLRELVPAQAEKVRVVPAGIDAGEERPAPELGFFLHVGRDEKRKRLEFLLRAYAQALRTNPALEMFVQVGADRRRGLDRLCRQLAIEQRVVWMGELDDGTLHHVLSDAKALVFPSALEGFGLPVLEALAHGTPAFVCAGGPPEWIAGDAGHALDPEDQNAWSDALLRASGASPWLEELAGRARARAAEFGIEKSSAAWLTQLREAAEGAPR